MRVLRTEARCGPRVRVLVIDVGRVDRCSTNARNTEAAAARSRTNAGDVRVGAMGMRVASVHRAGRTRERVAVIGISTARTTNDGVGVDQVARALGEAYASRERRVIPVTPEARKKVGDVERGAAVSSAPSGPNGIE